MTDHRDNPYAATLADEPESDFAWDRFFCLLSVIGNAFGAGFQFCALVAGIGSPLLSASFLVINTFFVALASSALLKDRQ